LERRIERELIPMAQTYGIAILPYSPLAAGFLAGVYRRGEAVPAKSRFDEFWSGTGQTHLIPAAFDVLDVVEALAREKGCSPAQLALAWCMRRPGITSPIIGPHTLAQLQNCLGALSVKLTPDDMARLDKVAPPGRATVPYYGADGLARTTWGPHRFRW
jgi:aryl-alcohol dehydrogenase-like predicted oxidoreductase